LGDKPKFIMETDFVLVPIEKLTFGIKLLACYSNRVEPHAILIKPHNILMKALLAVIGLFAVTVGDLGAQTNLTFSSLWSFNGTNGAQPESGLVQAPDGNFYGTTFTGGATTNGTVFQVTPAGAVKNLVSLDRTNGANPRDTLILGHDGYLYGTAYSGGTNSFGTLFQVNTNGSLTNLYSFSFSGGGYPIAGLVQDQAGNFYGTTSIGGTNSGGTVFNLNTNRVLQTLVSFAVSGVGGYSPYGGLVQSPDGSFYGTTYSGGTNDYGTVFRLQTNGLRTTVVSFNQTNGANPYGGLIFGTDGMLYGTTFNGGQYGYGTIFKLSTNGSFTTLVAFNNTNGAAPQAALTLGADGNLYGTTTAGGDRSIQSSGHGTIFELDTNGNLSTLFLFNGTNGDAPQGNLAQAPNGTFYGTTANGGTNGFGTVFQFNLIPPAAPQILSIIRTNQTVTFSWSANLQKSYQVVYKTNLVQAAWSNLNSAVIATNPIMTTVDTITADPQRFYRILMLP